MACVQREVTSTLVSTLVRVLYLHNYLSQLNSLPLLVPWHTLLLEDVLHDDWSDACLRLG